LSIATDGAGASDLLAPASADAGLLGSADIIRRAGKSAAAFRTISEVATDLDVPPHVLRFWESKFPQIRPLKRGGGRRYYRPEDIDLLRRIRTLLYRDGYTIKGVQKLLRVPAQRGGDEAADADHPSAPASSLGLDPQVAAISAESHSDSQNWRVALGGVIADLEALRDRLRGR
jgi:DNA-binding transcriptional MerR regulator